MSIFGTKKKVRYADDNVLSKINQHASFFNGENLKILREINTLKSDNEMGIIVLDNKYHNKVSELQNKFFEMEKVESGLELKIQRIKKPITIFAESKGGLIVNKPFAFGNGGKEKETGYVTMFPANISCMGLSSARKAGDVSVGIIIDGMEKQGYTISLTNDKSSKHVKFDRPLKIAEGSVINFISKSSNHDAVNTVASLIMEII